MLAIMKRLNGVASGVAEDTWRMHGPPAESFGEASEGGAGLNGDVFCYSL
jgi:hypothetical protein